MAQMCACIRAESSRLQACQGGVVMLNTPHRVREVLQEFGSQAAHSKRNGVTGHYLPVSHNMRICLDSE